MGGDGEGGEMAKRVERESEREKAYDGTGHRQEESADDEERKEDDGERERERGE